MKNRQSSRPRGKLLRLKDLPMKLKRKGLQHRKLSRRSKRKSAFLRNRDLRQSVSEKKRKLLDWRLNKRQRKKELRERQKKKKKLRP